MLYMEQDSLLPQRWLKVLFSTKTEKIKLLQFISEEFFLNINEENNTNKKVLFFWQLPPKKKDWKLVSILKFLVNSF